MTRTVRSAAIAARIHPEFGDIKAAILLKGEERKVLVHDGKDRFVLGWTGEPGGEWDDHLVLRVRSEVEDPHSLDLGNLSFEVEWFDESTREMLGEKGTIFAGLAFALVQLHQTLWERRYVSWCARQGRGTTDHVVALKQTFEKSGNRRSGKCCPIWSARGWLSSERTFSKVSERGARVRWLILERRAEESFWCRPRKPVVLAQRREQLEGFTRYRAIAQLDAVHHPFRTLHHRRGDAPGQGCV